MEEKLLINNRRYLGSKTRLINEIENLIKNECGNIRSFLDLFGGTGVVGYNFNKKDIKIIINDILESNYFSYVTWFSSVPIDKIKLNEIIQAYNNIDNNIGENYFSINFSNTYFSKVNAKKIGYIRDDIENLLSNKQINYREKAILVTSLLYALDKIANTVGHYDAFRKNGDLDRKLVLKMPDIPEDYVNTGNEIYKMDANKLVKQVKADIVYIDPPYNSRQYSDTYHLLENIATWEKPEVFGIAKKMDRSHIKSQYCTQRATQEFKSLISDIEAKLIIVSYNNMGTRGNNRSQAKISDDDIIKILSTKGTVKIKEICFNQFTTGKTDIDDHKERLFICRVGKPTSVRTLDNSANGFVKSPLNYTGGKYNLLNEITSKLPSNIETFVDMFTGGGNVGVNVSASKIICIDKQDKIIRLLNLFKKYDDLKIIKDLEVLIQKFQLSNSFVNGYYYYNANSKNGLGSFNKNAFLRVREHYNTMSKNSYQKDIIFLLLIIYSFNNQIRFNSNNEYNLPVGKRDFNNSLRNRLKHFVRKVKEKNIEFVCKDFRNFDYKQYQDLIMYFDPPYLLGTATYNENNAWTKADEMDLLKYIKKVHENNVKFLLSNVIEHKGQRNRLLVDWCLENQFNIFYVNKNYDNSNYQSRSKEYTTVEVLITNY